MAHEYYDKLIHDRKISLYDERDDHRKDSEDYSTPEEKPFTPYQLGVHAGWHAPQSAPENPKTFDWSRITKNPFPAGTKSHDSWYKGYVWGQKDMARGDNQYPDDHPDRFRLWNILK